jgi:tRNA threonylcarbamoyladenosine biosynthesis protein TsaB
MKLLAFDSSTETLSVAVQAGTAVLEHTDAGGPRASALLIPVVEQLLARAGLAMSGLDAIVFGRGPGSFTGLRTAAAVAQGLGFGAGVPVLPLDTLLAVAEEAHILAGPTRVVALLDARMGEVYCAAYERQGADWIARREPALLRPEQVAVSAGWSVAGNVAPPEGGGPWVAAMPTARALLRLAPARLAQPAALAAAQALPLYIRDKVAQTTQERAADRARKDQLRTGGAPEPK